MYTSKQFGEITEEKLDALSGPELVQLYNELDPEKSVRRFSDRKAGLRRVRSALAVVDPSYAAAPGPEAAGSPPPPAPEPKPEKKKDPKPPVTPERFNLPCAQTIKPHRRKTNRGKLIEMMSRENGASISEMAQAVGWGPAKVRASLKMIHSTLGHGIQEDENGRIRLLGHAISRKLMNWPKKGEIKPHRPGTKRAKTVELLGRPEGATMEEIREATGWNEVQSYQGVILVHTYLGYGLREDNNGRIHLVS